MRKLVAVAALLAMVMGGCAGGTENTDPLEGGNTGPTDHLHSDDAAGGGAAAACSRRGRPCHSPPRTSSSTGTAGAAPAGQAFTIKFDNTTRCPTLRRQGRGYIRRPRGRRHVNIPDTHADLLERPLLASLATVRLMAHQEILQRYLGHTFEVRDRDVRVAIAVRPIAFK